MMWGLVFNAGWVCKWIICCILQLSVFMTIKYNCPCRIQILIQFKETLFSIYKTGLEIPMQLCPKLYLICSTEW